MKRFGLFVLFAALAGVAGCNGSSSVSTPPTMQPAALDSARRRPAARESQLQQLVHGLSGRETRRPGCASRPRWCPPSGKVPIKSVTLESTNQFALGTDISHSHGAFEVECDPNASNVCQNDGFDLITFGQALYGPPAKIYPYRAGEALRDQGVLGLREPVRHRGSHVLHRDGDQLHRASADHLRDDAAERERIAHRSARRYALGLRRAAGTVDRDHQDQRASRKSSAARFRASRSTGRWPICSTRPTSRGSITSPAMERAPTSPAESGTASMRSRRCAVRALRHPRAVTVRRRLEDAHELPEHQRSSTTCKNGTLPSVSWVIPTLADSDHPASGCNHGPRWVTSVVNAIGKSKYWNDTAIVLAVGRLGRLVRSPSRRRRPTTRAWASAFR